MPDSNTLERRILLPRKTASELSNLNPILLNGQTVIEADTNKHKTGDGVSPWNSLPYGKVSCVNGLDSDSTIDPLSAAQGKALEQKKRDRINADTNAFYREGNYCVKYFSLEVSEQNSMGNQLYFAWPASENIYGRIVVTLLTTYSYQNASGTLCKEYSFANESGNTFENVSRYTFIGEKVAEYYSLWDKIGVNANMFAIILSRKDTSINNRITIKIEVFGRTNLTENSFYIYGGNWLEVTNTYKKPEYTLGNVQELSYKGISAIRSQEELNNALDNIAVASGIESYIKMLSVNVTGLSLNGGIKQVFGLSIDSSYQAQFAISYNAGMFYRHKNGGDWYPWTKVITLEDFTQSINAENGVGYLKLPSGVLLQWFILSSTTEIYSGAFPIAFPHYPRYINGIVVDSSKSGVSLTSANRTNCTLKGQAGSTMWVFAIGN
ncbi:pyocin knob domain-containing protein [Eubacterium sp. 1001713B170207_170306_E7]|uniref:pyocin knob domain-containing protein n=1 Tax=Eubacterium sp. 1001713B170207_170306_E7 TaxID=2787097 RepID=UPI00189B3B8F|nr:pyocin knob domain-containing protein [Eubacterium sp. 1001713B170207_170306_E7]